jgi:hypothetical protein
MERISCAICGGPVKRGVAAKHRQAERKGRPLTYPATCSRKCFTELRQSLDNPHLKVKRLTIARRNVWTIRRRLSRLSHELLSMGQRLDVVESILNDFL